MFLSRRERDTFVFSLCDSAICNTYFHSNVELLDYLLCIAFICCPSYKYSLKLQVPSAQLKLTCCKHRILFGFFFLIYWTFYLPSTPDFLPLRPGALVRRQAKVEVLHICFLQNSRTLELRESQTATELVCTRALI